MDNEILTVDEVAALLKVKPSFVHEKCRRRAKNPLPAHKVGKYLRFRRSEVESWFNATITTKKERRKQ